MEWKKKTYSSESEIILKYIYTESVKKEPLTKENIIKAFYVDYFQLPHFQNFIMKKLLKIFCL